VRGQLPLVPLGERGGKFVWDFYCIGVEIEEAKSYVWAETMGRGENFGGRLSG